MSLMDEDTDVKAGKRAVVCDKDGEVVEAPTVRIVRLGACDKKLSGFLVYKYDGETKTGWRRVDV